MTFSDWWSSIVSTGLTEVNYPIYASIVWSILVLISVSIMLLMFYNAHRDNKHSQFDLVNMITSDASGKIDGSKIRVMVALVVSTWGFVYLILNHQMSEFYFVGYMAVFVADRALTMRNARSQPPAIDDLLPSTDDSHESDSPDLNEIERPRRRRKY